MSPRETLSPRDKAAKALGAAMLTAIELTVREYMAPGQGEEDLPLSEAAQSESGYRAAEEGEGLFPSEAPWSREVYRAAGENESFDLDRFYRLRRESREVAPQAGKSAAAAAFTAAAEDGQSASGQETQRETFASAAIGAEDVSERFERDARRYDGPFRVYE